MGKGLAAISAHSILRWLLVICIALAAAFSETDNNAAQQGQSSSEASEYLSLVIRLDGKRSVEVVKAKLIQGKLIQQNTPASEYIYEITSGEQTIALGFISEDAFVSRGFMTSGAGEKVEPARAITISLNVPLPAATAKRNFRLRIYKVKTEIKEIDEPVLRQLKSRQCVSLELELSPAKINAALNQHE